MNRILAIALAAGLLAVPAPAAAAARMPNYFYPTVLCATCAKDAQGVPMYAYSGIEEYNPITIEQTALYYYSKEYSTPFTVMADWLVKNQTADGLWLYNFAFLSQPVPWWSAMAQGQGISVLVRGASWTGLDPTKRAAYAAAAELAYTAFGRTIADRGVVNGDWFEEYLPPDHPQVLNGMIFAMAGVRDWALYSGGSMDLWNTSLASLALHLPFYGPANGGCHYDRTASVETAAYDAVVNKELLWLYALTGQAEYNNYANRFARHC